MPDRKRRTTLQPQNDNLPARTMAQRPATRSTTPKDQAHGLRTLFAAHAMRFIPLVHNPMVGGGGAVMERLCAAAAERGLRTLVVDAADTASAPQELAAVDLSACVETLSPSVLYLAARGLPMRYLDSRATMTGFLEALQTAAPSADLVLLHASASDLRRMFAGRTPSPLLLANNRPDSLTQAYASMKLLSQRLGALTYDLVIAADVGAKRARGMADRLSECADHFLGAALRHSVVVDPLEPAKPTVSTALKRLLAAQLGADKAALALPSASPTPAAAPARRSAADRLN
jgi:flagellar biosynthesis protein FlhG